MTISHLPFLAVVTPPASEPVTLSEAKLYMRVDSTTEDSLISSLIATARMAAEQYTRRSLITQVRSITYDDYAPVIICLPYGPVQSVETVKLIARDGTETLVSAAYYRLAASKEKIVMGSSLMGHKVEITYTSGYGAASDVPSALRQGILSHMVALFEDRGGTGALPGSVETLYRPYRAMRVVI